MGRLRAAAEAVLRAGLLLGLALWMTKDTWRSPGRLVGGGDLPDWVGTLWTYWWTGFALEHGHNPFVASWNFLPVGQFPVAQFNLVDAVLAAPIIRVFGPMLGYNLVALGVLWTSGLAASALARGVGASPWAALVAGLSLESSTFLATEVRDGRLSQALLAPMLLGFLALHRLSIGRGRLLLPVAAGLAVAATTGVYWYYGLFLVAGAAPLWLAELPRHDRARWARLGLAAGICALIVVPPALILAHAYHKLPGVTRPLEAWLDVGPLGRGDFSLSMAIDQSLQPSWPLFFAGSGLADLRVSLGLLALALGGLFFSPRGRLRWLAVGVVGYILALGPYLHGADGQVKPLALPYLFVYDHLPFFDRLWWPRRWTVLVWISLGVLASLHADRLAEALGRRHRLLKPLALAACGLLLFADLKSRNAVIPLESQAPRPVARALYASLKGRLLTVPVLGHDPASRFLLYFQVFHEQPISSGLGAHLEGHRPPGYEDYIHNNNLLAALASLSNGDSSSGVVTPADVRALMNDQFTWAVIDPMAITPGYQISFTRGFEAIFSAIWGPPDRRRGEARAWRIRALNRDVVLPTQPPAGPASFETTTRTDFSGTGP